MQQVICNEWLHIHMLLLNIVDIRLDMIVLDVVVAVTVVLCAVMDLVVVVVVLYVVTIGDR